MSEKDTVYCVWCDREIRPKGESMYVKKEYGRGICFMCVLDLTRIVTRTLEQHRKEAANA